MVTFGPPFPGSKARGRKRVGNGHFRTLRTPPSRGFACAPQLLSINLSKISDISSRCERGFFRKRPFFLRFQKLKKTAVFYVLFIINLGGRKHRGGQGKRVLSTPKLGMDHFGSNRVWDPKSDLFSIEKVTVSDPLFDPRFGIGKGGFGSDHFRPFMKNKSIYRANITFIVTFIINYR